MLKLRYIVIPACAVVFLVACVQVYMVFNMGLLGDLFFFSCFISDVLQPRNWILYKEQTFNYIHYIIADYIYVK